MRRLCTLLLALLPLAAAAETIPSAGEPEVSNRWLPGYAIRYLVRIQESDEEIERLRTVQVALPTGGWLKSDASDLRVVDEQHYAVPVTVLSHDPRGDTLIQFARRGSGRWYWVYAVNPKAEPHISATKAAAISRAREALLREQSGTMELRSRAAQAATNLRAAEAELQRHAKTLAAGEKEHEKLPEWVAARQQELAAAQAALAPLEREVAAARKAQSAAAQAAAKAQAVVEAAGEGAAREAAAAAALPLRMAAAGAQTKLTAAEQAVAKAAAAVKRITGEVEQGKQQQLATLELIKGTEKTAAGVRQEIERWQAEAQRLSEQVASSSGKVEELRIAYRRIALESDPRLYQEGLALEVRDWGGDQLDELHDWPTVVAGLQRSDNILGNALITDLLQKMNPFRLGDNLNFAASYRGYLDIRESGVYRFLLNADDAAFLFINDYLVHSRVGSNKPYDQRLGIFAVGDDVELEEGVYPIEIHQVTGNTPGAIGRCAFYWMTPKAKTWTRVPPDAFRPALAGMVVRAEAPHGVRVPLPLMGVSASLNLGGCDLFLASFMAEGAPEGNKVVWEFGDGQRSAGSRVEHLYFTAGDHEVTLESHPGLPPFRRRFHLWPAPVATTPLALHDAVEALRSVDLDQFDTARLALAYAFLRLSGAPARWPLLEGVVVRLLREPLQDLQYRVELMITLMKALAQQGRAADAEVVGRAALEAAAPVRSLKIAVQMQQAEILHRQMQEYGAAARLYEEIVSENRRYPLVAVRQAATAWGDMYLAMGDVSRAATTYRLAAGLGRAQGQLASVADASKRGGLIRTAEKLLRDGNARQSRQILERIENEYPEQKVEGLFRFLRAESERSAGLYESAIMNYETVLRTPQWAGYHAQVAIGLADSCYRLQRYDEALKWLALVQESDPAYQSRKVAELRGLVNAGLFALKTGSADQLHKPRELSFATAPVVPGAQQGLPAAVMLGAPALAGEALTFTSRTAPARPFSMNFELAHLEGGALYWLDFWYSNQFTTSHAIPIPAIEVRWAGDKSSERIEILRNFGLHFKGGLLLRAPVSHQGRLTLTFHNWHGLQQLHNLRLRPVMASQEEALLNFFEGRETP